MAFSLIPIAAGLIQAATNPETAQTYGGALARQFSKAGKEYRAQMNEDRRRLAANDFGMSEAQKNAAVGAANRNQQAQARETEAGLRQQAAATGGRSPAAYEAMRGLGANLAGNLAAVRGNIEGQSAQLANQQREAALARLKERRNEVAAQGAEAAKAVTTAGGDFAAGYMAAKGGGVSGGQGAAGAAQSAATGGAASGAKTTVPSTALGNAATAHQNSEAERLKRENEELQRRLAAAEAAGG